MSERSAATRRPHIVIGGAGFGGLAAAKALAGAPVDVALVDRHNYHLFQPLLYQVATAVLSPADIASPIRAILRRQANTSVMLAEVTGIDMLKQAVVCGERSIPFDYLILATGARHAYFGHGDWEEHAKGIKDRRHYAPAPEDPPRFRTSRVRDGSGGASTAPAFRGRAAAERPASRSETSASRAGRSSGVPASWPRGPANGLAPRRIDCRPRMAH